MQTARKPDSVLDDHSSRRPVTEPLQQPTRKFRLVEFPPPELFTLTHRAGTSCRRREACNSLPIWSCSVWGLPCGGHYCPSGALLPHLFTLTVSPFERELPAVYSLLHWPSLHLEAQIPDVIRHTALRSPDFPPPRPASASEAAIIQPPAGLVYPGTESIRRLIRMVEVHRHRRVDTHCAAVHPVRSITPTPNRILRSPPKQVVAAQHTRAGNRPVPGNHRLQNHLPPYMRNPRQCGVVGRGRRDEVRRHHPRGHSARYDNGSGALEPTAPRRASHRRGWCRDRVEQAFASLPEQSELRWPGSRRSF